MRHRSIIARLEQLGIASPPAQAALHRVAIEAGLNGDRIALQQRQHDARVASGVADPPRGGRLRRGSAAVLSQEPAALRPPRPLPFDHAADIYFYFSQPIGVGPLKHVLLPLSYLGACGTSIPTLSNVNTNQPAARDPIRGLWFHWQLEFASAARDRDPAQGKPRGGNSISS